MLCVYRLRVHGAAPTPYRNFSQRDRTGVAPPHLWRWDPSFLLTYDFARLKIRAAASILVTSLLLSVGPAPLFEALAIAPAIARVCNPLLLSPPVSGFMSTAIVSARVAVEDQGKVGGKGGHLPGAHQASRIIPGFMQLLDQL